MFTTMFNEVKLYQLVKDNSHVDLTQDMELHELLIIWILRNLGLVWLTEEEKELQRLELWGDEVLRDGLIEMRRQLNLNEVDYEVVANGDQITTRRLAGFSRIIDLWHHTYPLARCNVTGSLLLILVLTDMLEGVPYHLNDIPPSRCGFYTALRKMNNTVLTKRNVQDLQGFDTLLRTVHLTFYDIDLRDRNNDEHFNDLVTLGSVGLLIHALIVILRRNDAADFSVGRMMWGTDDKKLSSHLVHSLRLVI